MQDIYSHSTNCPETCRHSATTRAVFEHMIPARDKSQVFGVPYITRPPDKCYILQKALVIACTLVSVCRI